MSVPEPLKWQESEAVRNLLKKQNNLLGDSLEALDHLIYLQKSINLLSSEEISRVMAEKLPYILSVKYFSFFLFDKDRKKLRLMSHNHPELQNDLSIYQNDSPIMKEAMTSGRYLFEQDFASSRYFRGRRNKLFQSEFFVSIPLMIENEIIGVLNLNDNEKGFYNVGDLDFALSVSEFVALSISNALLFETVEKLSVTDGLTGLDNHQHMQSLLKNEVIRCQRYASSLSIIMMDIDHFKNVNDTYGHQKGDDILLDFATTMKKFCRSNDVAARYGGEEFILVLPETKVKGAFYIAERIREEMANQTFNHKGKDFNVTVSCGIAEFDSNLIKSPADIIKVADQALYKAKHEGRNRTVIGSS
ncbi:MAG: GGDEF domain-containing protein [Nitrospina sp.]|jgi:diguanylate cyclase (GGDEF)-like protein|nr:GGDEF domain-containing protein [Nitrospina sp.]MBT6716352.1 GGDEF domain-containing protein [Nitrospina sp.]